MYQRPCTSGSITSEDMTRAPDSSQADPQHPKETVYRCFLPDLTEFTVFRRVGPNSQHRRQGTEAPKGGPPGGIKPR